MSGARDAAQEAPDDARHAGSASWLEASARDRVDGLLDRHSFEEFLGPEQRETSPHLPLFGLPRAFDDGVVIGRGRLDGRPVLVAAQEGRFMGGTFAEISGAKITGLLRAARDAAQSNAAQASASANAAPSTRERVVVLLLLDTGGVRLQEANAGELAVSENVRAIAEARHAGVDVIALVGGRAGAFGGGGIVTATCGRIVISQFGRTGVSGPEVIETNRGVEEFDSRDRALVWRITGGRTRTLLGGADRYVPDRIAAFRDAAIRLVASPPPAFAADTLEAEQARLEQRLAAFGQCRDATEIWRLHQVPDPDGVADLDDDEFLDLAARIGSRHDAR